jgi:protein disulfide-isomerase A1
MRLQEILTLLVILLSFSLFESKKNKKVIKNEEDEKIEEEFKLIPLNEKNYDQIINGVSNFLVLFHNPWCKFSQNLEKKLMGANKFLKMENQKYFIGSVDTTLVDAKKLISEKIPQMILNPLLTYPKIVYYKNGQPIETYKGKHNKFDIYTYLKRKINSESIALPIYSIFEDKIIHDKQAFIFFGDKDEKFEIFNNIAKEKFEWVFYHTNEDKIYEKLNPSKNSTVIYYNFGKKKDSFSNKQNFTLANFNKFLKKNTFVNLYTKVTEEFINEVIMKRQSAMILFRNQYDNKTEFLEENFPLISKGEPSLKFLITDMTGKFELKLANLMNVGVESLPAVRVLDFKKGLRRFEMTREPTMENVMNFIKLYKDNKLQPYTVTQGAQDDIKKKDGLKTLTSANFYETVIFNRKNVVVFFYASWCTHCKKVKFF